MISKTDFKDLRHKARKSGKGREFRHNGLRWYVSSSGDVMRLDRDGCVNNPLRGRVAEYLHYCRFSRDMPRTHQRYIETMRFLRSD